jgi:hypothetical protein
MVGEVITLTFGDCAENHVGMQKMGKLADEGFHLADLEHIKQVMESKGATTELVPLHKDKLPEAYVLVIRDGVNKLLNEFGYDKKMLYIENRQLDWDKKCFIYGRVVNKHARWNLCYDDEYSEPDYENKKGRVIAYDQVPITKCLRSQIENLFGDKAKDLKIEGNYYYDTSKCGISSHADYERKRVIGVRIGNFNLPIHFYWFHRHEHVGEQIVIPLAPGDIYIMSEKAVGNDGRKSSIYTLKHAVGANKYTTIKKKEKIVLSRVD